MKKKKGVSASQIGLFAMQDSLLRPASIDIKRSEPRIDGKQFRKPRAWAELDLGKKILVRFHNGWKEFAVTKNEFLSTLDKKSKRFVEASGESGTIIIDALEAIRIETTETVRDRVIN